MKQIDLDYLLATTDQKKISLCQSFSPGVMEGLCPQRQFKGPEGNRNKTAFMFKH